MGLFCFEPDEIRDFEALYQNLPENRVNTTIQVFC